MTHQAEPGGYLGILMRTPATNGKQPCDAKCERWGGLPHAHLHFDGLNDPTPYLTLGAYCSCGELVDPFIEYNADIDADLVAAAKHSGRQIERFRLHMAEAHGIDITTDEAWQAAATMGEVEP